MADWFKPSTEVKKNSQSGGSWFTPPSDVNPAKVLKGVVPLYTIKQQEQEAQEKEPTLLDKVYLSSAKQKQSIGAALNVPEIGVTMKYNAEPVKNPKNISQAINYKAELDKKETEKFEKAIQKTDDFSISGKALTDLSGITDKKTYQNIIDREGIYQYMTDDERRIYKYLIAKKDNASARKYLLDKMSDLESRKAYAVAGSNEGGLIGFAKDISTAAKSGLESGLTNMARAGVASNIALGKNMGVLNKLLEPTYSEKLYEQVRINANDKGYVYGILLDVTNSVSAQIPQIAMAAAGGSGAYLSTMAMQIIGADTTEAINQGYDGMRGVVYGIFDTALEFATEKVLGGIASKLDGGETSRLVRAALNAVDSNVSNKKVANALAKMISVLSTANAEGVEEFLQAIVEPVMRNVIYGEKNDINADTFEAAVNAYIVGALSGGVMDIPFANNILENTRADITGKFLKENAGVESVLKLSEVVGNNSEMYGEIKSSFDGGRDVSNTDLAMLYQQSAIMFEQPSEETYKNFAQRNVDALIKEAVNRKSNENKPESRAGAVLQSTAKADNTDNAVFHEPEHADIAEKLDPYDKYKTKENGYQVKDSRQRHIERVTNKLGAKITWSEDVKRGKYIPSERRIVLNPNLKTSEMYNFVFKHEFTHFLEGKQGYDGFKKYCFSDSPVFEKWVRERLEKNGIDSTGSREEVIQRLTEIQFEAYKNSDELSSFLRKRFTMENAEAEVLADFVGESLLGSGEHLEETLDMLSDLNHKQRGIFERIRDFIRDMINRFKGDKKFNGLVSDLEYLNERLKRVAESGNKKISDNETEKYSIEYNNADVNENVLNLVERVKAGEAENSERIYIGSVTEQNAEQIFGITKINVSGYKIAIEARQIEHILKDHGENGKTDHSMSDSRDIAKIPYIINNPESSIVKAGTTNAYVSNVNGKNKPAQTVLYEKPIGEKSYYVIQAIPDTEKKTLYIVSAFIGKQGYKKETLQTADVKNPGATPKSETVNVSNNRVPQDNNIVKNNISENTENDTEKNSIAVLPADELLDKYDRGEITREEYLKQTDSMTRRAALQYVQKWERENGAILNNQRRLEEEREKAVELEREEQQMRKDRESNIGAIRRTVRKLDRALRANTNAKHIPEAYKNVVGSFCKLFADNDQATFEHKELADIYSYYSSLKGDENNADAPQYDPYIDELLKSLIDTLSGKKLTELNSLELNHVRTVTDALNYTVDHEAQVFIDGKKAKYEEVGRAALNDIESAEPIKLTGALKKESAEKIREFFYEGNMLPEYFLKRMGSTFEKAFKGLADGQNKWARNMEISRKFVEEVKSKYDYDEWKDTTVSFRTESGANVEITIDQAMQLVATAQRERSNNGQRAKHLSIGGVVIDTEAINKAMKKQGKSKEDIAAAWDSLSNRAVQITFEDVDVISKMLTDAQKGYIKDFVDFLSTQCAAWGNEVTMERYGYRQFNESNYFPYVSSELFLTKDPAKAESTILRRASFTHSLQKNANNPLVLTSFTDIALQHMESMCNFNAMTVPLETLNKIFNYKTESGEGTAPRSVKAEMKNVFGSGAVDYMQNLIKDLNTGVRGDQRDSFLNKMTSLFKKNAVLANLSVIFQQPTAIIRAGSDMKGRYFAKAAKYFSKNNYEECKQYAPVAVIKQMGRFDTGVGVKNTTWLSGEKTIREKADDFLGWGAGKADEIAWSYLWSSVKAEIADTTDLKVGSEEFLAKAGERFTELVNKTQVYDSVLTKSQNMRNKGLVGSITSFMAEPTVALNMVVNSFLDFNEGKISGKKFSRTVMAVATAEIVTAMMQSFVTAARDDDEDKSYREKYLKNVVSNSLSNFNLAGKIPYIRDIMSKWEGYDVDRGDIKAISDLIKAFQTVKDENKTVPEKIRRISEALAALFGVPLKNIDRDIEAIAKTIYGFAFGEEKTDADGLKVSALEGVSENNILKPFGIEFFDFSKTGEYERMAEAAKRGDEKTYSESYNRLIENGTEDSDIRTGITKQFKNDKTVKKQSKQYVKELKQNDTFNSFTDEDKEKLTEQVSSALAKEAMVKATEREPDEYDKLYELYRTNKTGYNKLKKEMLAEGKTEKQINDGLELAKYAYLQSKGIDLHEYLLYKMATSKKYADNDDSGGVSKSEKKKAVENMDVDEKTRRQIREYLINNNF